MRFSSNQMGKFHSIVFPIRVWVLGIAPISVLFQNQPQRFHLFYLLDLTRKQVIDFKLLLEEQQKEERFQLIQTRIEGLLDKVSISEKRNGLILHEEKKPEFLTTGYRELFRKYPFCVQSIEHEVWQKKEVSCFATRTKKEFLRTILCLPKEIHHFCEMEEVICQRVIHYQVQHTNNEILIRDSLIPTKPLSIFPNREQNEVSFPLPEWIPKEEESTGECPSFRETNRQMGIETTSKEVQRKQFIDCKQILFISTNKPQGKLFLAESYQERMPVRLFAALEQTTNQLQTIQSQIQFNAEKQSEQTINLSTQIEEIKKILEEPSKKKKRKELPLRDPAGLSVYEYLMSLSRPQGTSRRVWARNRVSITLLRFLGVRASDLLLIQKEELLRAIVKGRLQIFQPKTKSRRIVLLPPKARQILGEIVDDVMNAFLDGKIHTCLGQSSKEEGKLIYLQNWRMSLNHFIKQANRRFPGIYTSHSFRINLVTRLLRTNPIHEVKVLIGHKDIRTTERYNRYQPQASQVQQKIEEALSELEE